MQTYFYLEEVSRHCQSYLQRSTTRTITGLHYHSSWTKENKEDSRNFFKDLDLLYHLMHLKTLALGLNERRILKCTVWHTTGFCRSWEEERRCLSRGDNFLQQLRRSGVSRVCGEKVAAARTEKLGTHSHTQDDCYHRYYIILDIVSMLLYHRYLPTVARVMTEWQPKCLALANT